MLQLWWSSLDFVGVVWRLVCSFCSKKDLPVRFGNSDVLSFKALQCLNMLIEKTILLSTLQTILPFQIALCHQRLPNTNCAITTCSLIVGDCSTLVINAQGAGICMYSFRGERKLTENNSLLHDTAPQVCVGPIYDLDRAVCWQDQWIPEKLWIASQIWYIVQELWLKIQQQHHKIHQNYSENRDFFSCITVPVWPFFSSSVDAEVCIPW